MTTLAVKPPYDEPVFISGYMLDKRKIEFASGCDEQAVLPTHPL